MTYLRVSGTRARGSMARGARGGFLSVRPSVVGSLAPVKCITLEITGLNRAEIAALKKKVDRRAFEALLGPVMK